MWNDDLLKQFQEIGWIIGAILVACVLIVILLSIRYGFIDIVGIIAIGSIAVWSVFEFGRTVYTAGRTLIQWFLGKSNEDGNHDT